MREKESKIGRPVNAAFTNYDFDKTEYLSEIITDWEPEKIQVWDFPPTVISRPEGKEIVAGKGMTKITKLPGGFAKKSLLVKRSVLLPHEGSILENMGNEEENPTDELEQELEFTTDENLETERDEELINRKIVLDYLGQVFSSLDLHEQSNTNLRSSASNGSLESRSYNTPRKIIPRNRYETIYRKAKEREII
jgi:hypothetical protein